MHTSLKLVHHSVDEDFPSVWEKLFLLRGVARSRLLIRVFAAYAGNITVQYVANVGMIDRRRKIREHRQVIFQQAKCADLEMAYAALDVFVERFFSADV